MLCRAFPDKARLESTVGGGCEQKDDESGTTRTKRGKVQKNLTDSARGYSDGEGKCTASIEGAGVGGSSMLCKMEARVVGPEQDGLFRAIVSFCIR